MISVSVALFHAKIDLQASYIEYIYINEYMFTSGIFAIYDERDTEKWNRFALNMQTR